MSDIRDNLRIEYVAVGDIVPYERNARKHADEDIDAIMASIREFGFCDPIGVWKGNVIVEGHGRLEAAKRLGMDRVPVIRLDHLTEEERRAYALAHNRTAELSGWDFLVRDEELAKIAEIDMSAFGFDTAPGQDGEKDESGASFNYQEQYGVIVMCENEADQEAVYTRLTEEGYSCKVVAV